MEETTTREGLLGLMPEPHEFCVDSLNLSITVVVVHDLSRVACSVISRLTVNPWRGQQTMVPFAICEPCRGSPNFRCSVLISSEVLQLYTIKIFKAILQGSFGDNKVYANVIFILRGRDIFG